MAAPKNMSGKGILFVSSKISRPDILSEETFMKWYDDDHIAEIIETSGIRSARRFVDVNTSADKPYLAMYAMDDIGFTQSDEFRGIRVKSDYLPEPGVIYDLADIDVRNDNLIHVYDPTKKGKGHTKSMITSQIELKEGSMSGEELDKWFREELCPTLSKIKGYLRTTRFKLVFARTNAQSRVLKGLAPPTDEPPPTPPTWLAMHEFECDVKDLDFEEIKKFTATPWHDKVIASASENETRFFRLAKEFGQKDWFHGVEM